MSKKWVYFFGEGGAKDKLLLGGKGANLSEMTKLGLPIPGGFTLTSEACIAYQTNKHWPQGLDEQVSAALARLERETGQQLGSRTEPLLLSVRSGAAISMPGMMDTVLNLGLNDTLVKTVARETRNPRFAYDSYRRFIQMFGDVVMGVERLHFERVMDKVKARKGAKVDTDLTAADLEAMIPQFKKVYRQHTGQAFPQDPHKQLRLAIDAVFGSWNNPRAIKYREMQSIPHDMGTAVNVQAMVFGNMGNTSATGVAFTRNPSTGENRRFGEYLMNAQGEDVVAGIRTPKSMEDMKREMPKVHAELYRIFDLLENHYRDMQDIEFTVQNTKLYVLQTRTGKRTAPAAVKMAVDMAREGLISRQEAVMRVTPKQLETLLHEQIDPKAAARATPAAKGLPASPGAAVGQVVFSAETAVQWKEAGKRVVLVRMETSPEDIQGMDVAEGILTARGGMTSHAAVVARGMNRCCVAGCSQLSVDEEAKQARTESGATFREGDWMTLDGTAGLVYPGKLPVIKPELHGSFGTLLQWSDQFRTIGVRANADTPQDAKVALEFGAEGIGLCRTEHMFFAPERILAVREMILSADTKGRQRALDKLLPFQRKDFHGILGAMSGRPVIVRLIDPPLHEFLPQEAKEQQDVARELRVSVTDVQRKIAELHEFNPMLGFRGCRLGVVYPEINAMQIRAIFEAALQLKRQGLDPRPCIEIPLVGKVDELVLLKKLVLEIAKQTGAQGKVKYEVGTMIEVPRAALTADEIAPHVDFMSFGTNDLTQMSCGFSRDDAGAFLKSYVAKGIYDRDPFQSIDQEGVGKLMRVCCALARSVKPNVDIGICGEHGGDPSSVEFCHRIGLDNVSCSPYRVPVARLAAAQAAIRHGRSTVATVGTVLKSRL